VVEFRGNLDTRLKKVADGVVDAAILAAAGIERLLGALGDAAPLDPEAWVPAPAQGALAVEALGDRHDLRELVAAIDHGASHAEVTCERAFAATLEGGCSVPLGCLARVDGSNLVANGFLAGPDGSQSLRDRISGHVRESEALGKELAQAILSCGGDELLADLREMDTPTVEEP
jgi:hydroxymethylbilane synthase